MTRSSLLTATALVAAGLVCAGPATAQSRNQIRIVGSSTVFPYTQAVAERFSTATGNPSPIVESTGTGGGMKIFCQGVGPDQADITGASRAMTPSEYKSCQDNGVTDVTEVLIGYDGLSIAHSRDAATFGLTEKEIYTALAAEVPVNGEIVANPHKRWSEINPELPDTAILVFGPPPTSGTRDAFVELAMHDGCNDYAELKELRSSDRDRWTNVCSRMRTDGPFVEAGENDNLIVQRLQSDQNALGIFGYSFLFENQDTLKPVPVNGVEPNFETIAAGEYDIARPLYVYIKNAHREAIPGLQEFVAEYVSDDALGADGYLKERGLTTLSDDKRTEVQDAATSATNMPAPQG